MRNIKEPKAAALDCGLDKKGSGKTLPARCRWSATTLYRAMEVVIQGDSGIETRHGISLGWNATQRLLAKPLEEFGIRRIQCGGATFEPDLHEAVMEI